MEDALNGWKWIEGNEPTHRELVRDVDEVRDFDSILYHGADWPMTERDMAAIAALPALLAAARAVVEIYDNSTQVAEGSNEIEALAAAITQADGQAGEGEGSGANPPATLPAGYSVWADDDGDWWVTPPTDVQLFSEPGEPLLLGDPGMTKPDAEAYAADQIAHILKG